MTQPDLAAIRERQEERERLDGNNESRGWALHCRNAIPPLKVDTDNDEEMKRFCAGLAAYAQAWSDARAHWVASSDVAALLAEVERLSKIAEAATDYWITGVPMKTTITTADDLPLLSSVWFCCGYTDERKCTIDFPRDYLDVADVVRIVPKSRPAPSREAIDAEKPPFKVGQRVRCVDADGSYGAVPATEAEVREAEGKKNPTVFKLKEPPKESEPAAGERVRELAEEMTCGHHKSLLVRSVESDYRYCDLCETKSRLRDALTMERELSSDKKSLESERDELRRERDAANARIAELESDLSTVLNWLTKKDRAMFDEMKAAKLKPRDESQLPKP